MLKKLLAVAVIVASAVIAAPNGALIFLACCAVWVVLFKFSPKNGQIIFGLVMGIIICVWLRAAMEILPLVKSSGDPQIAGAMGTYLGYAIGYTILAASLWAAFQLGTAKLHG